MSKEKPALIGLIDEFIDRLIAFGDELESSKFKENEDDINRANQRQILLEDLALFLIGGIVENESKVNDFLNNFSIQTILTTFNLFPQTKAFIRELIMAGSVLECLKNQPSSFDHLLERQRLLENLAISLATKLERIPKLVLSPIGKRPGITKEIKEFMADLIDYKRLIEKIRQSTDYGQEKSKRQNMIENLVLNLSKRVRRLQDRITEILKKPRLLRIFS